MVSEILKNLYKPVDNLTMFTHPVYNKSYSFLTDEQVVTYARLITEKIKECAISQIIVSETGASPFAWICQKLLEKEGYQLDWLHIKFPREPKENLSTLIKFYLTDEERSEVIKENFTRAELLDALACRISLETLTPNSENLDEILAREYLSRQNELQKKISEICSGTKISKTLEKKFLYFDEYIDSGTTLRNALMYFNYFSPSLNMQCLSYYMNISKANEKRNVFFSLFDLDSRKECFERGAYPFENRVDLIGYFYQINQDNMTKVNLNDFVSNEKNDKSNVELFLKKLKECLECSELLFRVKEKAKIKSVKEYVNKDLLMQYALHSLENELYPGNSESEFLWLLWDMYGPIWSPMPDEYHFDFWNAFEEISDEIKRIVEENDLFIEYNQIRRSVIEQIAMICLTRRSEWQKNILKIIQKL